MIDFKNITLIGCGRWGGFLGYYVATYKKAQTLMYGLPQDPAYQSLVEEYFYRNKVKYVKLG